MKTVATEQVEQVDQEKIINGLVMTRTYREIERLRDILRKHNIRY